MRGLEATDYLPIAGSFINSTKPIQSFESSLAMIRQTVWLVATDRIRNRHILNLYVSRQ